MKKKKLLLDAAKKLVSSFPEESNFLEFNQMKKASIIIYDKTEVSERACKFLCSEMERINQLKPMLFKVDSDILTLESVTRVRNGFLKPILQLSMEEAGALYRKEFNAAMVPERMVIIASAAVIQEYRDLPANWFCIEDFLNTDVFNFKPYSPFTTCGKMEIVDAACGVVVFDNSLNSILAGASLFNVLEQTRAKGMAVIHVANGCCQSNIVAASYLMERLGAKKQVYADIDNSYEIFASFYRAIVVVPEHMATLVKQKIGDLFCFYYVVQDDKDFAFAFERRYFAEVNQLAQHIDKVTQSYSADQRQAMCLWHNLYSFAYGCPSWVQKLKNFVTLRLTKNALDKIAARHQGRINQLIKNLKL